jgi:hypothetical protein
MKFHRVHCTTLETQIALKIKLIEPVQRASQTAPLSHGVIRPATPPPPPLGSSGHWPLPPPSPTSHPLRPCPSAAHHMPLIHHWPRSSSPPTPPPTNPNPNLTLGHWRYRPPLHRLCHRDSSLLSTSFFIAVSAWVESKSLTRPIRPGRRSDAHTLALPILNHKNAWHFQVADGGWKRGVVQDRSSGTRCTQGKIRGTQAACAGTTCTICTRLLCSYINQTCALYIIWDYFL